MMRHDDPITLTREDRTAIRKALKPYGYKLGSNRDGSLSVKVGYYDMRDSKALRMKVERELAEAGWKVDGLDQNMPSSRDWAHRLYVIMHAEPITPDPEPEPEGPDSGSSAPWDDPDQHPEPDADEADAETTRDDEPANSPHRKPAEQNGDDFPLNVGDAIRVSLPSGDLLRATVIRKTDVITVGYGEHYLTLRRSDLTPTLNSVQRVPDPAWWTLSCDHFGAGEKALVKAIQEQQAADRMEQRRKDAERHAQRLPAEWQQDPANLITSRVQLWRNGVMVTGQMSLAAAREAVSERWAFVMTGQAIGALDPEGKMNS